MINIGRVMGYDETSDQNSEEGDDLKNYWYLILDY